MTALLLLAAVDIVHLKSGGRQEGKVVDAGDSWRIERGNGAVVTVKKSDVREVVPCKFIPEPPKGTAGFRWGPRHVDAARFVRLDPPVGWRLGEPRGKAVASFFREPAGRMDLLLQRASGGPKEAAETVRAALENRLGREAVTAGADWIEASAGDQGLLWILVGASGDRVLTLAYAAPKADFDKQAAGVRAAAATLAGLPEKELAEGPRARFAQLIDTAPEDDPRRATEMLEEARGIVDEFAPLHLMLAQAWAGRGEGKKAEAAFRRARELDPTDLRAAVAFGAFLRGRTAFREAHELLDPLTERNPTAMDLHLELARCFLGGGKANDALACARHAVRLEPRLADAHYLMGACHERLGTRNSALIAYRDALIQDDQYTPAREALERLGWKP